MKKIMVTGAVGQIGSELTLALREKYGNDNVLATGHRTQPKPALRDSGPFEFINVAKKETIEEVVKKYDIDTIYHMSAILSAVGEKNPKLCWDVNMNGTYNILEVAIEHEMTRIFIPSSIAAFGPETPLDNTPQETILRPKTMYGVTKVAAELLCDYYVKRFGLDIRGCRYPGIISYETLPGGGTTDYAVAIYFEAVKNKHYTCFVKEETRLPMMYMPDCIKATLDLMEADFDKLIHHSDFNVTAMSFSAGELAADIKKHIPEFVCEYAPDFRQDIADSWPNSIDDTAAREEWGWEPGYDLAAMTADMLSVLQKRFNEGTLDY
ncbi:MAG: NAD-dependent epimerase/dehydratase family protein [Candidatus Aminicenantes bacterium]|nr:NAD-dependent epimerase/dehydratase family protein [Candidatus Aminicenantes bacterium]